MRVEVGEGGGARGRRHSSTWEPPPGSPRQMIRCPGAVPRGPGLCPERRETAPRQPRLGAVRGSTLGLPRGPCPGAPRLGAVPHLNNTLRTISDHARRFGGGQWSNRSVSWWSSEHGPGTGADRGCPSGLSRGKPKSVSCPETAPRAETSRQPLDLPLDLPRRQNPTFPERVSTLLPSSLLMPSISAMKFVRGKWGFGVGADLGATAAYFSVPGQDFGVSEHRPGASGHGPGAAD